MTDEKPAKHEILDIDDTLCAAHGGQQLAFWNVHYDERGFASMHIYRIRQLETAAQGGGTARALIAACRRSDRRASGGRHPLRGTL